MIVWSLDNRFVLAAIMGIFGLLFHMFHCDHIDTTFCSYLFQKYLHVLFNCHYGI
uniref:Uncharacterized protein n=1 Tax=Arundo donax TaxID=35708 RepID=A0A0A9FGD9_ARUDO